MVKLHLRGRHAIVIPLYGVHNSSDLAYWKKLRDAGFWVELVDNNPSINSSIANLGYGYTHNANRGALAGALNRGVARLLSRGDISLVSFLDQDSRISPFGLRAMAQELEAASPKQLVVGPLVWDQDRNCIFPIRYLAIHGKRFPALITSGTTFVLSDWNKLGSLNEDLGIDFVDTFWCCQISHRGWDIRQCRTSILIQKFGKSHPNALCRILGMQLYSPQRHYFTIKNMRRLWGEPLVPRSFKIMESLRLLIKPWLWILFEPDRLQNIYAIIRGLKY